MSTFPNEKQKELIKKMYPAGTRVKLIRMEDPWTSLKPGDEGTIQMVDDAAQIHVNWDRGSSLALIPGVDKFEVIK